MTTLSKSINRQGRGNIYFDTIDVFESMYGNTGMEILYPANKRKIVFYDVNNAQQVYKKTNEIIASIKSD